MIKLGLGINRKIQRAKIFLQKRWFDILPARNYADHYRYQHILCAVAHNEEDILEEWLLFHLSIGIEYFVIFDHNSTDGSREKLRPYEKAGLLEWRDLKIDRFTTWQQAKAYNTIIPEFRHKAKWIWFLDTDEFLVPTQVTHISEITGKLENDHTIGGIAVNWLFFGTAHVEDLSSGKWHIEELTRRAPLDWKQHSEVKCGIRPEATPGFFENPHTTFFYKNRRMVYADGTDFNGRYISHDILKIHHYWHRTEKFYREVKLPRRMQLMGTIYGPKGRALHHEMRNRVVDESILRFIPRMKELKNKFTAVHF